MPDILCLGEPLLEFNHLGGADWRQGFGGDVSNVAVAAARQGASAGLLTRVGADRFGISLEEMLRAEGVDTTHVARDEDAPTGLYFVTHGEAGHEFAYRRKGSAASRMTPEDLPPDLSGTRILHLSGITQAISESARATADAAMDLARQSGARVSYDPNLRLALWPIEVARPTILRALASCDIALPGLDDARVLLEMDDPEDILRSIQDMGPAIVALTMGRDGVLLGADGEMHHVSSPTVDAVDATGAGDCFDGAFIARLVAGDTPLDAARYATQAAALSTLGYGAVGPIPNSQAVRDAMKRAEPRRPAGAT
ncbi:2-dehydro-3-deoxygluconokinase (plasmid) [Roseivivax sp. THAF40]|uniref:sugar kinase n=1 Tax=unclassified Roseivivax TaxID=2639302 RepID=UPI001267C35E|nr:MULTISPECIES: sugar kinase [unclassified Roseivivax]QFS84899.1 2-dehydro-3-deoxygluconokinase [Roseivivax sp. THAF197b]QFT48801.1 2-dehydro-3-deoxygluconokinase [Roseivivax sp. THAF40]